MKKNIKIILIATSLILLIAIAIVYAATNTAQEPIEASRVSEASITSSSELLNKLNSEPTNIKTRVVYDDIQHKAIYEIENAKYFIDMDTNNKLVGIHAKSLSTNQEASKLSKDDARAYIQNKYQELNLPSEYELNYLEKYDDLIWQANFEKNYDGIYNKYESVKVYFIPDTDEIISLGVFYEAPSSEKVEINSESAIQTSSSKNNSEIVNTELTMEKASDGTIRPTWVITHKDNEIIYVDAESNNIIGGDTINE